VRSIRLSLLFYFLGLLAIALGAASVLAYQTAQRTLNDKKETTEKLVQAQFEERCRKENERFDNALLARAENLAQFAQLQFDWGRARHAPFLFHWNQTSQYPEARMALGLASLGLIPNGHVMAPIWMGQGSKNFFFLDLSKSSGTEIKLQESDLLQPVEKVTEFFQISNAWGSTYRSQSLGPNSFPFDFQKFGGEQVLHWEFDESTVGGASVRRVWFKAAAARVLRPVRPPPGPRPEPRGPRPESGRGPGIGPPRNDLEFRVPIFVQCAWDTRQRDADLKSFQGNRAEELDRIEGETATSLQSIRARLLLISTITFLATVLGSVWLVRYGLSPLRRLSEAVSQVSTKDFRLPFAPRRLPAELKPIVEHLKGTLEMLKRAFAREKQATADISHELRTPLAALLTTTEIALRKPRSTDEYRELLQDCQLSAQQMNQAIDRMLALARLDAGVDTMRPQAVDVSTLAEQCAAVVRPLAEARHLTLTVHRKGPAEINADPDKLREVLNNLLHNAIQYNRPNGFIDLLVTRNNGHLQMEVSDTGIGIPAEAREHIFERFYRADPSRGADGLHTGLGLAIVKGYVDLMGGSIDVESVEGQGSTFRVQLPVR
jgi:heavy metal sensor kinase